MDPLFERFERILRSYFRNGSINEEWNSSTNDQDFRDAFDELDEFLKTGESSGSLKDDFFDGTGSSSSFRGSNHDNACGARSDTNCGQGPLVQNVSLT